MTCADVFNFWVIRPSPRHLQKSTTSRLMGILFQSSHRPPEILQPQTWSPDSSPFWLQLHGFFQMSSSNKPPTRVSYGVFWNLSCIRIHQKHGRFFTTFIRRSVRFYSSTSIRQGNSRFKPWGVVEKKHNWQGSSEIDIFGKGSNKQQIYDSFPLTVFGLVSYYDHWHCGLNKVVGIGTTSTCFLKKMEEAWNLMFGLFFGGWGRFSGT